MVLCACALLTRHLLLTSLIPTIPSTWWWCVPTIISCQWCCIPAIIGCQWRCIPSMLLLFLLKDYGMYLWLFVVVFMFMMNWHWDMLDNGHLFDDNLLNWIWHWMWYRTINMLHNDLFNRHMLYNWIWL